MPQLVIVATSVRLYILHMEHNNSISTPHFFSFIVCEIVLLANSLASYVK